MAYDEHVGVNRQDAGVHGETAVWYNRTIPIKSCRSTTPPQLTSPLPPAPHSLHHTPYALPGAPGPQAGPPSSNASMARRRPISRRRRFTRFRCTIECRCLGTMSPRRERETGEAAKKTSRCLVLFRFPRSSNSRISDPSRIRAPRGSASTRSEAVRPTCCRS